MNGPWSDTPSAWVGDDTAWVSGDVSVSVGVATVHLGPSTATASPVVAVEVGAAQGSFSSRPCTIINSFPATGFVTLSTEAIGVDTSLHSYDTYSPSSGVDDGHWFISGSFNGQLYNSSSDVVFGYRSDDKLDAFCRFDISIPRGATIISAVPIFTCKQNCSGLYNLNLYFAALDDPFAPTSASVTNALPVTSAINWTGSTAWVANSTYQGPDISSILQEVVDREGFESGNHALLIIKENNSSAATARYAYALEGDSTKKIKLLVEWRAGAEIVVASSATMISAVQTTVVSAESAATTSSAPLGVSANGAVATADNLASVNRPTAILSPLGVDVTISTPQETTVSVERASASLLCGAAAISNTTTGQAQSVGATLQASAASSAVECSPCPAIATVSLSPVPGLAVAEILAQPGDANFSISPQETTVSTESLTVVRVETASSALAGQLATVTCGCVASLDAVDLAIISDAAAEAATATAGSGQASISTALNQASASSQSIATPALADISVTALSAAGSPHVDATTASLGASMAVLALSFTSATAASCSSARLAVSLLQVFTGSGNFEIWRYDSGLSKSGRLCSSLPDKTTFDSGMVDSTILSSPLAVQKAYDSNLAQNALFKTNVKVEKALV